MLKIIVVDDEMLVRVGIASCIHWEENGFEMAGQAGNGKEALELVKQKRPDIVITDIKMPVMDGIELIQCLKRDFPSVKIIVLSCINEMEYVKTAMKLGAEDYILKLSMEESVLLKALAKVQKTIEKDQLETNKNIALEKLMNQKAHIILENLFRSYLNGSIGEEHFQRELRLLEYQVPQTGYQVIYLVIEDYKRAPSRSRIGDSQLLKFSITNIIKELLANQESNVIEMQEGHYLIVYANHLSTMGSRQFCHKLNTITGNYLEFQSFFGISKKKASFTALKEGYEQSLMAIEHCFYQNRGELVYWENIFRKKFHQSRVIKTSLEADFRNCAISMNMDGCRQTLKKMEVWLNESYFKPEQVREFFVNLAYEFRRIIRRFFEESNIQEFEKEVLTAQVKGADYLFEMVDCFVSFTYVVEENLRLINKRGERQEIVTIKLYIEENIGEKISLDQAANMCHVNKSYLSTLFKKEMNEGFNDYVNRVKMEKAKELIEKKQYKIYDAAWAVGIKDESYFSKLFKKYLGVSPSQLRK